MLAALAAGAVVVAACAPAATALPPTPVPTVAPTAVPTQPPAPSASLLASGLEGATGSTIGPDGALYVTEGTVGRLTRVDPRTGEMTTLATGLPPALFPGLGGAIDVAFIDQTAYALVTLVGSDWGGDSVVGIYRMDGPDSFTVIADIGAWAIANPPDPTIPIDTPTGVQFSLIPYAGGFLVADGHHNRVLKVGLDGAITEVIAFKDVVPTGLAMDGHTLYMAEAGPVPHLPENGKIVSFDPESPAAVEVAAGARLLVDVEMGPGGALYGLSQGFWAATDAGEPANPNTGALMKVNGDGTFTTVLEPLNQPTSLEFIGSTAYIVTLGGEVWRIDNA